MQLFNKDTDTIKTKIALNPLESKAFVNPKGEIVLVLKPGVNEYSYNRYEGLKLITLSTLPQEISAEDVKAISTVEPAIFSFRMKYILKDIYDLVFHLGIPVENPEELTLDAYQEILVKKVRARMTEAIIGRSINDIPPMEKLEEVIMESERIFGQLERTEAIKITELEITKLELPIKVPPNCIGILYTDFTNYEILEPGITYKSVGPNYNFHIIPIKNQHTMVTNQEVLTKDNISLRFSYHVVYKIGDIKKLAEYFDATQPTLEEDILAQVHIKSQTVLRDLISDIDSEEINSKRSDLFANSTKRLKSEVENLGVHIESLTIRDITFPKSIQDMFAEQLAAEIKAKAKLEIARAEVAAARAEKNAAEIMHQNPNIKFLRWLETLQKMSERGRHTFNIGTDSVPEVK